MIKAIIFDMDGVIARTDAIQGNAESKILESIGIYLTAEEIIAKYNGYKDTEMFKDVLSYYGKVVNVEKLREKKWKIVYKVLSKKLPPIVPGVIEMIDRLCKHGFILAIASATNRKFITTVVDKLKIKSKFKIIASGDEVAFGKPNPEIFLLAAKKIHLLSKQCLVIEDAPNGVKAAKAAGMKCIAITTTATREELKDADRIINSFEELNIGDIQDL